MLPFNFDAYTCVNTYIDVSYIKEFEDLSHYEDTNSVISGIIYKTINISGYESTIIRKKLNWMLGVPYMNVYDIASNDNRDTYISDELWNDRRITYYEPIGFISESYLTDDIMNNIRETNELSIEECIQIYNETINYKLKKCHCKIKHTNYKYKDEDYEGPSDVGIYINPLLYPAESEIYRYPYKNLLSEKDKYEKLKEYAKKWSDYPLNSIISGLNNPDDTTDYKNYSFPKLQKNPYSNQSSTSGELVPASHGGFSVDYNKITNSALRQINSK